MGIFDKLREWMGRTPELQYDRVRVVNLVDGTTIEGHEAVRAHLDAEQKLIEDHGSSLIFQVYRVNLQAKAVDELQGPRLAEIKLEGGFVSGTDTVGAVKRKLRSLIAERMRLEADAPAGLRLNEADQMSLSFSGRRMEDDRKFYADHFMLLPAWVQVLLHACDDDELMALARRLHGAGRR